MTTYPIPERGMPPPVPDFRALCAELVEELHAYKVANAQHDDSLVTRARAVLAAPRPIPVTERLPGADDCDAKGKCWWFFSEHPDEFAYWVLGDPLYGKKMTGADHWLPAQALPLPEAEAEAER